MINSFTVSFFEGGSTIHYMTSRGAETIDYIPDELQEAVGEIVQYLEDYKTPQKRLEEEIISRFIETASDDELLAKKDLFQAWQPGTQYERGEHVSSNDRLYKVVQTHIATAQPGAGTRALYEQVRIMNAPIESWDAEQTYMFGDKYVDDEGIVWESNTDSNHHNAVTYPAGWRRLGTLEEVRSGN